MSAGDQTRRRNTTIGPSALSALSQLSPPRTQPRTPRASLRVVQQARRADLSLNPNKSPATAPGTATRQQRASVLYSSARKEISSARKSRPSLLDGRYKRTSLDQIDTFVRGPASVALHGLCAVGRGTSSQEAEDDEANQNAGIRGPMRVSAELAGHVEAFKAMKKANLSPDLWLTPAALSDVYPDATLDPYSSLNTLIRLSNLTTFLYLVLSSGPNSHGVRDRASATAWREAASGFLNYVVPIDAQLNDGILRMLVGLNCQAYLTASAHQRTASPTLFFTNQLSFYIRTPPAAPGTTGSPRSSAARDGLDYRAASITFSRYQKEALDLVISLGGDRQVLETHWRYDELAREIRNYCTALAQTSGALSDDDDDEHDEEEQDGDELGVKQIGDVDSDQNTVQNNVSEGEENVEHRRLDTTPSAHASNKLRAAAAASSTRRREPLAQRRRGNLSDSSEDENETQSASLRSRLSVQRDKMGARSGAAPETQNAPAYSSDHDEKDVDVDDQSVAEDDDTMQETNQLYETAPQDSTELAAGAVEAESASTSGAESEGADREAEGVEGEEQEEDTVAQEAEQSEADEGFGRQKEREASVLSAIQGARLSADSALSDPSAAEPISQADDDSQTDTGHSDLSDDEVAQALGLPVTQDHRRKSLSSPSKLQSHTLGDTSTIVSTAEDTVIQTQLLFLPESSVENDDAVQSHNFDAQAEDEAPESDFDAAAALTSDYVQDLLQRLDPESFAVTDEESTASMDEEREVDDAASQGS